MSILNRYNSDALSPERVKQVFGELLEAYMSPAFGSMSKRDFDILLFGKLQDMNLIDSDPDLYVLLRELRVTRSKARNLLYESKLRKTNEGQLDQELKDLLCAPMFLEDGNKIAIEISSPLLIDHLRAKLRQLKHITDGSFSPELVRMSTNAYLDLFEEMMTPEQRENARLSLIRAGAIRDTSFKGVLKSTMKKLWGKVAGRAGEEALDNISDYLTPIIEAKADGIMRYCEGLFRNEEDSEPQT